MTLDTKTQIRIYGAADLEQCWEKVPSPPDYVQIEATHYGDGNYCEVSLPDDITEAQIQQFENWLPEDSNIDEDSFQDGLLRRNGALWLRMYTHSAAPTRHVWDIRTTNDLVALQQELSDSKYRRACKWAIEQAKSGQHVYVAQDEDGFYFATRIE